MKTVKENISVKRGVLQKKINQNKKNQTFLKEHMHLQQHH